MIIVQQNKTDNTYEIKFPYNEELINRVKLVPGRRWNPDRKVWSVPSAKVGMFLNQIYGTPMENSLNIISDEDIGRNAIMEATTSIPDVDLSGITLYCKDGSHLYQHQIDTLKFAIDRENKGNKSGFLLTDQPGLGKSLSSILVATYHKEQKNYKHCLIICCVNSSKYNWEHEIEEQTQGKYQGYILGSRIRKNGKRKVGSGKDKLHDLQTGTMYGDDNRKLPYFIIVNIEAIRQKQKVKNKYEYPFTKELIEQINNGTIDMCIIDEVHKGISPQSTQGKCIIEIKRKTGTNCYWIPMTGTPIVNKPTDVFLPLKLIDAHNFNSYYLWCQHFCVYGGFGGHEIISYKNIPYLKELLQGNMLRRLKSQALDLPDKVQIVEYVENTDCQQKITDAYEEQLRRAEFELVSELNPMTKLLRLRQINDSPELIDTDITIDNSYLSKNAKMSRLLELVDDIIANGEKVVIFSIYLEPLRVAYRFLHSKYKNIATYTGTMKEDDCEANKQRFQTDPNCRILLGTVSKAGTTHTFTAANNVIFYDEPWTPTDKLQCEDRVHRIGLSGSLNVYTLITKDTIDERVHDVLYSKSVVADYLVDNKLDIHGNIDLLRSLLK